MRYFFALLVFVSLTFAQQQLSGTVFNSSNNEPLSLANIKIQGTDTGSASDENGNFSLDNVETGDVLIISYIGFETKEVTITETHIQSGIKIGLSPQVLSSQSVLVRGIIGKEGFSPITFSKITSREVEERYINQDVPEFLSYMPNTTFYSESGHGIGYNYLSIRGFDQRRISVSINGIPQNEPEDHNIYWLDLPNLLGSTELIQVQRGSGAGIVGYPAVGGSINIITKTFTQEPEYRVSAVYGSYNTRKYTATFSSGLIEDKYSVYAKMGKVMSSGYRENSWADFNSYHIAAARYDENVTTQVNIYGGPISDGLVYNGLPKFAVDNEELRKENLSYWEADNNEYTYKMYRRPDEKENFSQPHFELLNEFKLSDKLTLNNATFLILGDGFFDYDGSWADTSYFRLTNEFGWNVSQNPSNVLIRAMVENTQWGIIPRLSWKHTNGELIAGLEYRNHRSVHWGSLNYGENLPEGITKDYRYYYYEGGNDILNFFVHETYNYSPQLNFLAEVQLAYHKYIIENEKYLNNEFDIDGLYLNPKLGINYKFTPSLNGYISFARVTREPRLKNYYDAAESSGGEIPQFQRNSDGSFNFNEPLVEPEKMNDIELGTTYNKENLSLSLNLFYMLFDDEIVKSGQLDRFGQPITGNIDETVHTGIEFSGTIRFNNYVELTLNGSYGKNYISSGKTYLNYDDEVVEIDLTDNRISGFPDVTLNGILKFELNNFSTQIFTKYVGDFYSDNYDEELATINSQYPGIIGYGDNKVDGYFVANLISSYQFELKPLFGKVKLFAQINNIFDNLYAAYAVGKEFFPAAERNYLVGLNIGL